MTEAERNYEKLHEKINTRQTKHIEMEDVILEHTR